MTDRPNAHTVEDHLALLRGFAAQRAELRRIPPPDLHSHLTGPIDADTADRWATAELRATIGQDGIEEIEMQESEVHDALIAAHDRATGGAAVGTVEQTRAELHATRDRLTRTMDLVADNRRMIEARAARRARSMRGHAAVLAVVLLTVLALAALGPAGLAPVTLLLGAGALLTVISGATALSTHGSRVAELLDVQRAALADADAAMTAAILAEGAHLRAGGAVTD